jgi:hypothetical protein
MIEGLLPVLLAFAVGFALGVASGRRQAETDRPTTPKPGSGR